MGLIILTLFATDAVAGFIRYIPTGLFAFVLWRKDKLSKGRVYSFSVLLYFVLFVCLFQKMYHLIDKVESVLWMILIIVGAVIIKAVGTGIFLMVFNDSTLDESNNE